MENNEIVEKICALRGQFEDLASRYSDDEGFVDSVNASLDENELLTKDKIREDFAKNTANERLLRIGIVGAVKAGKSSLLNALFFDGNDILPKAATPMTAALTELSYGEKCEISIDFFTENDVLSLKEKSETYSRELKRITEENLKKNPERDIPISPALRESVKQLKQMGWSVEDIAKQLKRSVSEIELILQLEG